jgi:hypothetical protein
VADTETYVSTIRAIPAGERLDFDLGYIFAHSEGQAEIGTSPVVAVTPGRNTFNFNTHVAEGGLSYLLAKEWIVHLDYQFHYLDQDGREYTDAIPTPLGNNNTDFNLMTNTEPSSWIFGEI